MSTNRSAHEYTAGEVFDPLDFTVTPELNQQYLYAVEEYSPIYWDESEFGAPLVHPSILLNMSNRTRSPAFYLEPGWASVHASDDTQFVNPAFVGRTFTVSWKVGEVYQKRGRIWNVIETGITDDSGTEIMRRKFYTAFVSSQKAQ